MSPHGLTWIIAALATAGVILRPFNWPEAIWAVAGAALLVVLQLLSLAWTRSPASAKGRTSICS